MPKPQQFRTSPVVLGLIGFALVYAFFGLGGCDLSYDQPRKVCVRYGDPYVGSRGGTYRDCIEYGIACLKPLVLDSRNGSLICRMREPGEQANTQG